jgi:hypothetical protein
MEKKNVALTILLLAGGVLLLVYGLSTKFDILPCEGEGPPAAMSEVALTQEVTRGGVAREESGEIRKTYEEGEEPPEGCPT